MQRDSFSTGQILEIAEISRRTLERWHALNLLVPFGGKSPGKGTSRQYSFGDLMGALVLSRLRAARFPLELSTSLVRHACTLKQSDSVSQFVVLSAHGDFVPLEDSDLAAHFARDDSKVAVVLHLGSIHEEAIAATAEWSFEMRPRRGPKPGQAPKKRRKRREENKPRRHGTKDKLSSSVRRQTQNNASKHKASLSTSAHQNFAVSASTRSGGEAPRARGQTKSVGRYNARPTKPRPR
jgi:DNA-binding transcriptional MerR regulator